MGKQLKRGGGGMYTGSNTNYQVSIIITAEVYMAKTLNKHKGWTTLIYT